MPKIDQRDLAAKPAPTPDGPSKGRNIVTVIGIDSYEHWPQLNNAVSDSLGALKLFTEKLGFTAPVEPLFDKNATRQAIEALVRDRLAAELQNDDSLVLFFAGHGHTQTNEVGLKSIETGYLVPVQAQRDRYSDYLKIDSLLEDISKLAAKHVLVILDACYAGFALGSAMKIYRSAVRYEADLGGRVSPQGHHFGATRPASTRQRSCGRPFIVHRHHDQRLQLGCSRHGRQ